MPLIEIDEHRPEDLAAWRESERESEAWGTTTAFRRRVAESADVIRAFLGGGEAYVSTSWGKDSVVAAHLAISVAAEEGMDIPLVHVLESCRNPHNELVEGQFRLLMPQARIESVPYIPPCAGSFARTLDDVRQRFGARWIGGIRGQESGGRARRIADGLTRGVSCQPMGLWSAKDVFAYLHVFGLPVHPAYAMTFGGSLDRDRLRVCSLRGAPHHDPLLGIRGDGMGRDEWEQTYYGRSIRVYADAGEENGR